jgi:hypothetical protein
MQEYMLRDGEQYTDAFLQRASCQFPSLFGNIVDLCDDVMPTAEDAVGAQHHTFSLTAVFSTDCAVYY